MRNFYILFISLFINHVFAQNNLSAGDIAVVSFRNSSPDHFEFVVLTGFTTSETISFTNEGWLNTGSFRGAEGTLVWVAPNTGVACGTIVSVDAANSTSSVGTVTSNTLTFGPSGDQLIAYQGAHQTPKVIFAINNEGNAVWQSNASSFSDSALPTGLINGETAVAVNEYNNTVYNGVVTNDTKSNILAAICDASNWEGANGSNRYLSYDGPSFTITDCTTLSSDAFVLSSQLGVHIENRSINVATGEIVGVYNIFGQVVENHDLSSGIYLAVVSIGQQTITLKVMIP